MFAKLIDPPRIRDAHERRTATWLELFYDLVYVATFVQLGNHLSDDVSLGGFAYFALLFVPIWWSWIGTTYYNNRFDSDDVEQRFFVFLQIFTVSLMAIFTYDALGETSAAFALAYAANRFVLMVMYLRAGAALPAARALSRRSAIGIGVAAALWVVSAFVPAPLRFILWGVALLIDVSWPFALAAEYARIPLHHHHLGERFALLTIIVFGEGFLKVIGGLGAGLQAGEIALPLSEVLFNMSGFLVAISLWWVYFENVADTHLRHEGRSIFTWTYMHLPYQLAIVALGVALYKVVIPASYYVIPDTYRWLFGGMVALSLVSLAVIEQMTEAKEGVYKDRLEFIVRIIGAVVALVITALSTGTSAALFAVLLTIPCVGQVLFDLWRRVSSDAVEFSEPALEVGD